MGNSKIELTRADGTKEVLIDLTGDTVAANKMLLGTKAHDKSGTLITGTIGNTALYVNTPTINASNGVVTASASTGTGYIIGTVNTNFLELPTQGAKTIHPSLSQQTAVAKGKYTTGAVTVAPISYALAEKTWNTNNTVTWNTMKSKNWFHALQTITFS